MSTNNMKCTCQRENFALGTQRNLYSIGLHWDLGLGVAQTLRFSVFRYQHVGIPNAKFRVGGLSQRKDPTCVFASQWNMGLKV